jgi:hypothetical protein
MAIPNINKILQAQAAQRGEAPEEETVDDREIVELLKLIFEYMKQTNEQTREQLAAIYKQEEEIKEEIRKLKLGSGNE